MQRIEKYRDISVGRQQDLHCELEARVVLKGWMSGQAAGCDASDPLRGDAIDALCTGKDGAGEGHGKKDAKLVRKICGGFWTATIKASPMFFLGGIMGGQGGDAAGYGLGQLQHFQDQLTPCSRLVCASIYARM
jgi:hypothetical protein